MNHELLEEARQLAIQLKEIKAREMEIRKTIAYELGLDLEIGTHHFSLHGFKIKLKLNVSYNLEQDELIDLMNRNLLTDEELGLIKTKYSLSLSEYKKAGNTETLDDVIIVTPSAPTLDITLGEE